MKMIRPRLTLLSLAGLILAGCSGGDADSDSAPAVDGSAAGASGQSEFEVPLDPNWEHPLTAWGDPDLQGNWPINHLTGVPLQRDPALGERRFLNDEEMQAREAEYADRNTRYDNEIESGQIGMGHWVEWGRLNNIASLLVEPSDGRLPALTAEGERRRAEMRSGWMEDIPFDHYDDFDNWDRCITRGLPASMLPSYYNAGIQILQSPGYVVIRLEMIHEARLVRLDSEGVDQDSKAWLGYSTGRWEGNTLVVETRNFIGRGSSTNIHTIGSPPYNNTPISHDYVLTERFTRTSDDTMLYRATVHDPVIWTADWTVELPWVRQPDYQFFEYACAEDNTMVRNYINSSRAERGLIPVAE